MRDHVSERRDGLNDTSGGSSETDANEFTISPAGSPPGAAVTNATPVAKRPSPSRNSRASGGGAAWAVEAARTMSVERRLLAERDAREVVVRPVRAERVHERAGLDVAVCTREGAPVHVAGPARQGQRAVDDLRRGLADEGLRGLCLREERPQLVRRAVRAGVGGAVVVDQGRGTRQGRARGGQVDDVVGELSARPRVAVDPPGYAAPGDLRGRLGDPERGRRVVEPGDEVALHVRHRIARAEAAAD